MQIDQNTTPPFVPFDETRADRVYRGNLPHWRQDGCTYFITYRLGDSLPGRIVKIWKERRQQWLAAHGITWDANGRWHAGFEKLPAKEGSSYRKKFNRALNEYLDRGYGSCLLRDATSRQLAVDALRHFEPERFWLGDFVIMPNHVHALITPREHFELEDILASIKRYSSRQINRRRGRTGKKLWQKETYDHIVRDLDELKHYRRYIKSNPVRAKVSEGEFSWYRADWVDVWSP